MMHATYKLYRPLIVVTAGAVLSYLALVLLHGARFPGLAAGSGAFAAGAVYTQLFEYFFHRIPMHRGLRHFEFVKRQHLNHHRIFAGENFRTRRADDMHHVTTCWFVFPLLLAVHYGLFSMVLPGDVMPAFFLGVTAHFLAYESLHYLTHLRDNAFDRWLSRAPLLGPVRALQIRHHETHHDVPMANFNFTPPYGGDRLGRTLAR